MTLQRAAVIAAVLLVFTLHLAVVPVSGNTEIVSFDAEPEPGPGAATTSPPLTLEWPSLSYAQREGRWALRPAPLHTPLRDVCEPLHPAPASPSYLSDSASASAPLSSSFPCPHELWVALDLAHARWSRYSRFTLRLSWPASSPASFTIDIFSPTVLARRFAAFDSSPSHSDSNDSSNTPTRRKYARIRMVDTGVLTPSHPPTSVPPSEPPQHQPTIPFALVLEPLYLGVLPASVLPILAFLVPVVGVAWLAVPWVYAYLGQVACRAGEELRQAAKEG